MNEKDLMKWILIIAFIGVGILLVRWIRNKIKEKIMDQSMPEPVDEEDVIISDMVSSSHEQAIGRTIPVYKFNNVVEAIAIKAMLEENNIPCVVTSFEDLAYDGIYQDQKGWGVLKVFEADSGKADELIKSYLAVKIEDKTDLPVLENIQPETNQSFIRIFIYKAAAALLIGLMIGSLLYAIWHLIG